MASSGGGSITASSRTYDTDTAWYVIDHSTVNFIKYPSLWTISDFEVKITAASGASVTGIVFLGRPWRVFARVIYQFSTLTNVVNAKGWAPMTDGATPYVEHFQC